MIRRGGSNDIEQSTPDVRSKEELECRALVCPEEEGGYSVHCMNLPGVISQGETLEEAIENISDAFRETVLYYRGANETIPWGEVNVPPVAGSKEERIIVSV